MDEEQDNNRKVTEETDSLEEPTTSVEPERSEGQHPPERDNDHDGTGGVTCGGGDGVTSECPTYKDMATWTVEDDMPSPMDSSTPLDSPDLAQLRRFKPYTLDNLPLPPHPYLNSPTEPPTTQHGVVCPAPAPPFTISSQLLSREARLYENVPPPPQAKSGIESLGLIFHPPHHNVPSPHGGGGEREGSNNAEFLSVSDFLNGIGGGGGGGGPPSRGSWVDSGRESLSFDGEPNNSNNSNNSNSSRNGGAAVGGSYFFPAQPQHHDLSPSHHAPSFGNSCKLRSGEGRKSRRDRLVRQKHAIDENFCYPFQPNSSSPTSTSGGGVHSMCSYLAVPSPRRSVLSSGIAANSVLAAVSPISLHRHPNPSQILLQENKKTRSLIPGCESPYAFSSSDGGRAEPSRSYDHASYEGHGHGGSFHGHRAHGRLGMSRSPSRGLSSSASVSSGGGGKYKVVHSSACARYKQPETFDYGELPSHQMFPKRHLPPPSSSRQFTTPYGGNVSVPAPAHQHHHPLQAHQPHRSFPASLLSSAAPRSCSMGDLSSGIGPPGNFGSKQGGGHGEFPHHVTIPTVPSNQQPSALGPSSNGSHLVASLPLPPATSVTYEFSLAPVSGTLAPGWHLTAVQRGLATAVPLAAAVARRRLPRPRPLRPRFGFTDKTEARRAKCTIAVTALALLAMSMLLVGITLRLAPLIDDLVRKENEDLLRSIVQTPSSLNVSLSGNLSIHDFTSPGPPPPPPPPESWREPTIPTNNIISISNLHVQKHRGTKSTTTTTGTRNGTTTPDTRQRWPHDKVNQGQVPPSSRESVDSSRKSSDQEVPEDRDEAMSVPGVVHAVD